MHYDGLGDWARNGLLPAVLIVLGAILIVRFVRWAGDRYQSDLDRRVTDALEGGEIVPDDLKRSRAVTQAVVWATVALTSFVAVVLGIRQLGVPLATLIAPATVAGVAIGFGAQSMVADVLAGFFLFSERQFGIGDLVRLSTPGAADGITGTVEALTLRVTKLRTAAGDLVVVPNSALRQVTNLSRDWSRAILDIPIPGTADVERAAHVLRDAAASLLDDPSWARLLLGEPAVSGIESMEVEFVRLRLTVRTVPGRQFDVSRELRLRCARALRREGIVAAPIATTDAQ
jgi:small conductance mechanosensitive channel